MDLAEFQKEPEVVLENQLYSLTETLMAAWNEGAAEAFDWIASK